MRAELTYAEERWATFWPEAEPLMRVHSAEVDSDAKAPFEVNVEMAEAMDAANVLVIVTARAEGRLIGYSLWYLGPALDSRILCATQGPWFVVPEWRKSPAGIRVFEKSLDALRARGVARALPHHWMQGAGPRLGDYFARLGAKPIETTYSLWLKEPD